MEDLKNTKSKLQKDMEMTKNKVKNLKNLKLKIEKETLIISKKMEDLKNTKSKLNKISNMKKIRKKKSDKAGSFLDQKLSQKEQQSQNNLSKSNKKISILKQNKIVMGIKVALPEKKSISKKNGLHRQLEKITTPIETTYKEKKNHAKSAITKKVSYSKSLDQVVRKF